VRSFRYYRSRRREQPPLFSRILLATVAMSVIYASYYLIGGMLGVLLGIPLGLAASIAAILCWASRAGDG
jgi:hypothetical protein